MQKQIWMYSVCSFSASLCLVYQLNQEYYHSVSFHFSIRIHPAQNGSTGVSSWTQMSLNLCFDKSILWPKSFVTYIPKGTKFRQTVVSNNLNYRNIFFVIKWKSFHKIMVNLYVWHEDNAWRVWRPKTCGVIWKQYYSQISDIKPGMTFLWGNKTSAHQQIVTISF